MTLVLRGVGVSPGVGSGIVATMPDPVPEPAAAPLAPGADVEAEAARLDTAVTAVRDALLHAASQATGTAHDVLTVEAAMAADPGLAKDAARRVRAGATAPRAVWDAAATVITQLEALGGRMAERVRDIADIRDRVVAALTGVRPPGVPDPGHPFVLVAQDLAPADTATLDPARVLAIATTGGGPTSHTAILARALGIPAVVAASGIGAIADGTTVIVDGTHGDVLVDPDPATVVRQETRRRPRVLSGRGRTADGHRVELLANVADPDGAAAAAASGAEGVGLFRTEFCFLGRADEPSVDEQVAAYRRVLDAFHGRKVVIRTLDAGADKPLPFVTAQREPNPALGVRGLRTSVRHAQVLHRQLEAIAKAATAERADVWVMAPMVATPEEAQDFVAACSRYGLERAGVMVELPAAALQSRWIFQHATFASIGTNDLTQYTMAADRELADLAALSSPWQPAVLALVQATCVGAAYQARPVGVCGEAASDPALAAVLVGLGVTSLSMTPGALGDVAAVLASVTVDDCRRLARIVLDQPTAEAAQAAVRAASTELVEFVGL